MGFYDSIEVSSSGLTAQRLSMDVIANNIANANTTRTAQGGPFKRQLLVLAEQPDATAETPGPGSGTNTGAGVVVQQIVPDNSPDKLQYDPSHPDADARGFVHMPNIEVVKEMVDMIAASRAYQANVTAIQEARQLDSQTMSILQA